MTMVSKPGTLHPVVEVCWEGVFECRQSEMVAMPVDVLEKTPDGEALHRCMRDVAKVHLARVTDSPESHPVAALVIESIGPPMFSKGVKYRVRVEKLE